MQPSNYNITFYPGIIDESMTGLVVWLEGHSLVQTVFTNLYTHKPEQVQNSAMQGFTFAYLKIVEVKN